MVHNDGYTLRAIRRLLDFAPCWEIRCCSERVRARCAPNLRIPTAQDTDQLSSTQAKEITSPGIHREQSDDKALVQVKIIYGLQEFGTVMHCSRCIHAERTVRRVASEFDPHVQITKHDILSTEAQRYGVLMTPAIVINDEVVSVGKAPSEDRLRELIQKYLAHRLQRSQLNR
jgi:hypothetical protein